MNLEVILIIAFRDYIKWLFLKTKRNPASIATGWSGASSAAINYSKDFHKWFSS